MKNFTLALLVVCILATSGYAQSSLFGQFDIISTNWAKLPSGGTWDGETPSVATDGKGTVAVLIRQAPHFRFFKSDGTFIKAWGEIGLSKYSAAPALSALAFHSPTAIAVRTTIGILEVAGSCLSIAIASTAVISGRFKSVIMRSGSSAKALPIACAEFSARDVSYPTVRR